MGEIHTVSYDKKSKSKKEQLIVDPQKNANMIDNALMALKSLQTNQTKKVTYRD